MKPFSYILPLILGGIAALCIGGIVHLTDATTTIDAWMLTFTVSGQDVGDRMVMFIRTFLENSSAQGITGFSYLIGHSISEEIIKFAVFLLSFRFLKPSSIHQIILTGIFIGIGFAFFETLGYYDSIPLFQLQSIFLRSIGHGLFTGLIALLFGLGYFSQLRWIDAGAHKNFSAWAMRYAELLVIVFWTIIGLLGAAFLHSTINILVAVGAHASAIIILMVSWTIFIFFLSKPESRKPYGDIIRGMDLLRTITDAREDLEEIEQFNHSTTEKVPTKKPIKRKRFAKTEIPLQ